MIVRAPHRGWLTRRLIGTPAVSPPLPARAACPVVVAAWSRHTTSLLRPRSVLQTLVVHAAWACPSTHSQREDLRAPPGWKPPSALAAAEELPSPWKTGPQHPGL